MQERVTGEGHISVFHKSGNHTPSNCLEGRAAPVLPVPSVPVIFSLPTTLSTTYTPRGDFRGGTGIRTGISRDTTPDTNRSLFGERKNPRIGPTLCGTLGPSEPGGGGRHDLLQGTGRGAVVRNSRSTHLSSGRRNKRQHRRTSHVSLSSRDKRLTYLLTPPVTRRNVLGRDPQSTEPSSKVEPMSERHRPSGDRNETHL